MTTNLQVYKLRPRTKTVRGTEYTSEGRRQAALKTVVSRIARENNQKRQAVLPDAISLLSERFNSRRII